MSKVKLADIENAFQPAKEATKAERFAGREDAVKDAYLALISDGAHIAVIGNRGIGKTSLARQIANIAKGDNSLLEKLELRHDDPLEFLTVYLACGNNIGSTEALLERLLTSRDCLGDWIYDVPRAKEVMRSYSPKFGVNLAAVRVELGGEKQSKEELAPAIATDDVENVFTNVVSSICASDKIPENGILIIVDEFDQIKDPTGFARFLKAIATNVPKVKFCLVGVAQDIAFLMKEHQSSDRLFAGAVVPLPPMDDDELQEIIAIAEKSVAQSITFTETAKARVISLAQGHPYMVHLIGKYAFRLAYERGDASIDASDIDDTLRSIAERGADPILEARYKKAVAASEQREIVLKCLAESQRPKDAEIWTTEAYKLALDRGVENASQYVGQLVSEEYGAEVEKLRERVYRFHDSLFAAYVCARPSLVPKRQA